MTALGNTGAPLVLAEKATKPLRVSRCVGVRGPPWKPHSLAPDATGGFGKFHR